MPESVDLSKEPEVLKIYPVYASIKNNETLFVKWEL
jgi:hypothetical protein